MPSSDDEQKLTVARREVFDIRTQLMAEDDDQDPGSKEQTNDELIAGLEQGDIKPNFYEGGFKTWECALDLAKCVLGDGSGSDGEWRFIEVGLFFWFSAGARFLY